MRWDSLFGDLEGQLEYELGHDDRAKVRDEERARVASLSLRERITALKTVPSVRVDLVDGTQINCRFSSLGKDWFAGDLISLDPDFGADRMVLVPLPAVAAVVIPLSASEQSLVHDRTHLNAMSVADRIGFAFVLRDLARRRRRVTLIANGTWFGTIDRVGVDHLDLAMHDRGEARRHRAVTSIRIVPLVCISRIEL